MLASWKTVACWELTRGRFSQTQLGQISVLLIQRYTVKLMNTYVYHEVEHHPNLWTLSMQHMLHAEATTFRYFHGADLAFFCV